MIKITEKTVGISYVCEACNGKGTIVHDDPAKREYWKQEEEKKAAEEEATKLREEAQEGKPKAVAE